MEKRILFWVGSFILVGLVLLTGCSDGSSTVVGADSIVSAPGGLSGNVTWVGVVGFIVAMYEALARLIPTIQNISILAFIIDLLKRLVNVVPNNAQLSGGGIGRFAY